MNAQVAVAQILERRAETKSSLSAKSGVSRALIDDYLKGRRQPSVDVHSRLRAAASSPCFMRTTQPWTFDDAIRWVASIVGEGGSRTAKMRALRNAS